jgi:hypothetical protein
MARPRPHWRAPLTNYPKGGGPGLNPTFLAKRTFFGCFAEGSGRRQCAKIAKSTGQQCRCNAVQGRTLCRHHGGTRWAMRDALAKYPHAQRSASKRALRAVMAEVGWTKPEGFPDRSATGFAFDRLSRSQVGEAYHCFANRHSNPKAWRDVFENAHILWEFRVMRDGNRIP